MDLRKFTQPDNKSSILHTSVYAQVARGEQIGATSAKSYAERRLLENSRQHVKSYGESAMGQRYGVLRAKSVASKPGPITGISPDTTRQGVNAAARPPQQFGGRSYNPYA